VESISSIDQELPGKVVGLDMLNFRLPLSSYFFLLSLYSKGTFVERFSVWSTYGDLMGHEIDQCEIESLTDHAIRENSSDQDACISWYLS
jgi:hypothetical protein